jgi:hypothetical protein
VIVVSDTLSLVSSKISIINGKEGQFGGLPHQEANFKAV